jgi:NADPH2:quinone reductase
MAAASLLQGLTAHFLTKTTYPVQEGDTVLIHAAAGGVGTLLVQMAKEMGAFVIGTVSTEEKAELARELGADEVIRYTDVDFLKEVQRITSGKGVDVVYDGVGKSTFDGSIDSLKVRGFLALYGSASGPVPPIDPMILSRKGSLFLTRASIFHYIADREEYLWRVDELFATIGSGSLEVVVEKVFPLSAASEAHEYLESRKSKGKILLAP